MKLKNYFLIKLLMFSSFLLLKQQAFTQITTSAISVEEIEQTVIGSDLKIQNNVYAENLPVDKSTENVSNLALAENGLLTIIKPKKITKTISLNESWKDTGIEKTDLTTGTYIIQVFINDQGGKHFHEYYSGIMSWWDQGTNSSISDNIELHRAGHAPNSSRIYLRTKRNWAVDGGKLKLQIKANYSKNSTLDFKFLRLL